MLACLPQEMSNDDVILEFDYCCDDGGMCDRPHLENGRRFTVTLKECFEYETVCNDVKYLIQHMTCGFFFSVLLSFFAIRLVHPLLRKT